MVRFADTCLEDPASVDLENRPEHFVSYFHVGSDVVHASIWLPEGAAKKPFVVLVPQLFGGDRLESLIIPLINAGIGVLTFHPRGMWDTVLEYSLIGAIEDTHAAVAYLVGSDSAGETSPSGRSYAVDPERIAVLGLSGGGGNVSVAACAENTHIKAAIAIAPGNFDLQRDRAYRDRFKPMMDITKTRTAGRIDLVSMLNKMVDADFDRLSIAARAGDLVDKHLLLVGASRDLVAPVSECHVPIQTALEKAGLKHFTANVLEADHTFMTKRSALARLVISWLRTECGF